MILFYLKHDIIAQTGNQLLDLCTTATTINYKYEKAKVVIDKLF